MTMVNTVQTGYKGRDNKADVDYWLEQIRRGEKVRDEKLCKRHWKRWKNYYEGDWARDILPLNLFFMMIRSTVPRVYFRNPSVSIQPSKPGVEFAALAKIQERIDNKMLRAMKIKRQGRILVRQAFMYGASYLKLGFGGYHTPSPLIADSDGFSSKGNKIEYEDNIYSNMAWGKTVHPGHVTLSPHASEFDNSRFIAHELYRDVMSLRMDPRFSNTKDIQAGNFETDSSEEWAQDSVKLYEVRDKYSGQVFVIAPSGSENKSRLLFQGEDVMQFNGFPLYQLVFNDTDESAYGIPDSKILEPYQKEINEIKTQIMKHRRLSIIKLIAQKSGLDEAQAVKMVSESVLPVVFTNGDPKRAVHAMQAANIPPDLIQAAREIMQDVRDTVGFSRNQFGEYRPGSRSATATEANIVRASSEIRVDERRDLLGDVIVDFLLDLHELQYLMWEPDDIVDLVGPGGARIWVQFTGKELERGRPRREDLTLDFDNAFPLSREDRQQRALQIYQALIQNPLIDPRKVTDYLLREMVGVQFDDMMQVLPGMQNVGQGPVNPKQYGQMIEAGVNNARTAPAGDSFVTGQVGQGAEQA